MSTPDDSDDFQAFENEVDMDKTVELTRSTVSRLKRIRDQGPRPCLVVIAGPAVGQMVDLPDEGIVLGRSHEADVTLVDDGISRKHAQIGPSGIAWRIDDLGSTNGIFINGEKKPSAILENGDQIRIGSTTILKFSLQDEVEEDFQRRMYDQAVRDSLTNVFNKRYFKDSLDTEFSYYSRHDLSLSVIMLDIDFFKQVNDTYGHVAGDHILKKVAKLAKKILRTEDILCRYGGEEFAIILRTTDAQKALLVAERIRKAVARSTFNHDAREIKITVSLGVATLYRGNFESPTELVRAADKYLYAAKEGGRNRTECAPARRPAKKVKPAGDT